MTEKELIVKLRQLRQIEPRKDWVVLTKGQILGEETYRGRASVISIGFYLLGRLYQRPALVFLSAFVTILFIGGLIFYLPKESDPINRIVSEAEEIENLSPALAELEKQISQTTQGLKKMKIEEPRKTLQVSREIIPVMESGKAIVSASKKLKEELELKDKDKKGVVGVLAIKISETENALSEMETAFSQLIESAIYDLEKRTLTQEQAEILKEAKRDFEDGNYSQALIKILTLSQNK